MDWITAAYFLLVCELALLPLRAIFSRACMPDDIRRALARAAGPVVVALPLWALAHLFPSLLGAGAGRAWWAAVFAAALIVWWKRHQGHQGHQGLRGAAPDLMALALYFGFVALRRQAPEMTCPELDLSAGAEKFGNQMIFWSCWHATALPPQDFWLAGRPLSYYYWGHFMWAWLGRVGGLPAECVVTLALARAATMVWELSYVLARALKLRPGAAMAAALAAAWGGNPAALAEAWRVVRSAGLHFAIYPYWNPSRAIDPQRVVSEFPAFSAILGDFHAHHLALPWWTAFIALLVAGARWSGWNTAATRGKKIMIGGGWTLLAAALACACVIANLWNLPLVMFALGFWCLASIVSTRRAAPITPALVTAALVIAASALMRHGAALPLPVRAGRGLFDSPPLDFIAGLMPGALGDKLRHLPLAWLPAELRTTPGALV